jgi:hypothetical protein
MVGGSGTRRYYHMSLWLQAKAQSAGHPGGAQKTQQTHLGCPAGVYRVPRLWTSRPVPASLLLPLCISPVSFVPKCWRRKPRTEVLLPEGSRGGSSPRRVRG